MMPVSPPIDHSAERIAAREAEILGGPPRIAPLSRETDWEPVQALSVRLRKELMGDGSPVPVEAIPELMFIMGHNAGVWDRVLGLSVQMQSASGTLPPRIRQLAILRTSWLLQAPYEWGEHVQHSLRAGISHEEIEAVIAGPDAQGWSDFDRAVLRAADELRNNAFVSDGCWAVLSATLNEAQLIELLVVIGHFTNLGYLQNTLRLQLERSNQGLRTR